MVHHHNKLNPKIILCVRNASLTAPHLSNLVTRQMCSLFTARQNWKRQKLLPWFEQKSLRVLVELLAVTTAFTFGNKELEICVMSSRLQT